MKDIEFKVLIVFSLVVTSIPFIIGYVFNLGVVL